KSESVVLYCCGGGGSGRVAVVVAVVAINIGALVVGDTVRAARLSQGLVQPGLRLGIPALVEVETQEFYQGLIHPGLDRVQQYFPPNSLGHPHLLLVLHQTIVSQYHLQCVSCLHLYMFQHP
nr:hypothetical protein [Tanacetum cinerariifolium]